MEPQTRHQTICEEIASEVRDMAISLFAGRLDPEMFAKAVLALEAAKVKRHGFHLTAERLPRGGIRFTLLDEDTEQPCATLVFDSATEKLGIHHLCG